MAFSNMTTSVMSDGGLPSTHIHLEDSLGAAFIGLIFAAILSGITYAQSINYFRNSSRDSKYMTSTIAFLWILDAFHLALVLHVLYFFTVTNFSDPSVIYKRIWSLCLQVLVTTTSDFIIRLFFVRRVWILSKQNRFLTGVLLVFTFVTLVFGIIFGIKIFSYKLTLDFSDISWILTIKLSSAVAVELWAAISLFYFLAMNRSGLKATDTKLDVLILYVISTGLLTSFCAIGSLISFATMPNNFIFIGFFFSLSKLYFNSLLATLNARGRSCDGGDMRAYQMTRVLHVRRLVDSRNVASLDVGDSTLDSMERSEFSSGDKNNYAISIPLRAETSSAKAN